MASIEKRAAAERTPLDWRAVRLFLVAVIPLVLGYMVGAVVWLCVRVAASFMEGFDRGRGPRPVAPTPQRRAG
jgi:hypothetical protein